MIRLHHNIIMVVAQNLEQTRRIWLHCKLEFARRALLFNVEERE